MTNYFLFPTRLPHRFFIAADALTLPPELVPEQHFWKFEYFYSDIFENEWHLIKKENAVMTHSWLSFLLIDKLFHFNLS